MSHNLFHLNDKNTILPIFSRLQVPFWGRQLAFLAAVCFIGLIVLGSFLRVGWNSYDRAMLNDMVRGTAHRPFVYRALTPFLIRRVMDVMPDALKKTLEEAAEEPKARQLLAKLDIDDSTVVQATASCIVMAGALILFAYAMVWLLRSCYRVDDITAGISALFALAGLPPFFRYYSYIYDFPTLALFTLSLVVLAKRKWWVYFPLLALTTVSKETAILLPLIFAVHYRRRLPTGNYLGLLGAQLLLFATLKGLLTVWYSNRPGSIVESHIVHNLMLHPYDFAQYLAFVAIFVAILYEWENKPAFLKNALVIVVPLFCLTFVLGLIDEYRDYYEAYPVAFALVCHTVNRVLKRDFQTQETAV
ncbi:MAG: hypothetical protein K9N51_13700 [Candidatus Pacebacteria bacterium]|nr:hypothetical protein [Candidatus Paceibacterota bacterium]